MIPVLDDVWLERRRQDRKWGEQNHPIAVARDIHRHTDEMKFWKRVNDWRNRTGQLTWDGILLEEVYEALSEVDPEKIRAELVQVAAVAVAMIECIDRQL